MWEKRLLNVAFNRPATQSSTSEWSRPNDASGAVSGALTNSFSFCTAIESNAHWMVDLQAVFKIRRITIYNRDDDCADRVCPLIVEASVGQEQWVQLATIDFIFGGVASGTPLILGFRDGIDLRFLRLRRLGPSRHFHLAQVEVHTALADIESCAQMGQDVWVLAMTGGRANGRFVEIGSADGVHINNTYLLEKRFDWRGVCVEPNPESFAALQSSRSAKSFQRAVFHTSGEQLEFVPIGELGTILDFKNSDLHSDIRNDFMVNNPTIKVSTISPTDLFQQGGLPPLIDFLSLDTEGSEWDILQAIDFSSYRFGLMAIEHNYVSEKRDLIYGMLKALGYYRLSVAFDDWYYHPIYLDVLNGNMKVDYHAVISDYRLKYGYGEEPA